MFLLFLLAIYLDIAFRVLKFGGKSSPLGLLTIIGFAIVINTFGSSIALIHIRGLFISWNNARLTCSNDLQKLGISMYAHNFQLLNCI